MTIAEIIQASEKRIVYLQGLRASAAALGDMQQVNSIDASIVETQDTLNKLRTLS